MRIVVFDTPGHANHHFSIYDPISNGIFVGDTLGVKNKQIEEYGFTLYLPATSPNQFDPDKTLASLQKIKNLGVERIYFGHFSMAEDVDEVYKQIEYWLPIYVKTGEEVYRESKSAGELKKRLLEKITAVLDRAQCSKKSCHLPNYPNGFASLFDGNYRLFFQKRKIRSEIMLRIFYERICPLPLMIYLFVVNAFNPIGPRA